MRSLRIWAVIPFCFLSTYAQTVNLTGTVTDSAGNSPLSGVHIVLAKLGYSDTTGSDGKYSIVFPPVSIIAGNSIGARTTNPRIIGNFLVFTLLQRQKFSAALYSPAGRAIGTIIDQDLAPGTHRAALPSIQKSDGIYYVKVISGKSQEVVKYLSVKEKQRQHRSVNQSGRLNKKLAVVDDTLFFQKPGFQTKNAPITAYEGELNLKMTATPNAVDTDGNVYHSIIIGTQVWMVENLKTTKYNDGTPIPLVTDDTEWVNLPTPGYCWYKNDTANKAAYGALYNWYTVKTGNLAPTGWQVPSDSDWSILATFLGGISAGASLKSTGTKYWRSPNTGATNSTGFSAVPGGCRNNDGAFKNIGYSGYWWSTKANDSTYSWLRYMDFYYPNVYAYTCNNRQGLSIRCVKKH